MLLSTAVGYRHYMQNDVMYIFLVQNFICQCAKVPRASVKVDSLHVKIRGFEFPHQSIDRNVRTNIRRFSIDGR